MGADLLVLLSDIDGLFTADPKIDSTATLVEAVYEIDSAVLDSAGGKGSSLGTGGMKTKISAAQIATESGCDMVIMNGSNPEKLYDLFEGKSIGTRFYAKGKK